MNPEKPESEFQPDNNQENRLLSETTYEGSESSEFDAFLKARGCIEIRQKDVSPETDSEVLYSKWHTPCHDLIVRTADGKSQLFHVQPNNPSYTLLSYEQERNLKKLQKRNAEAIVAKGKRAWFGPSDEKELFESNIKLKQVIDIETSDRWRLLYDPIANEIWIDIQEIKTLKKYRGF